MKFIRTATLVVIIPILALAISKFSSLSAPQLFEGVVDETVSLSAVAPVIAAIPEQYIDHKSGESFSYIPKVLNSENLNGLLHWVKDYGPDEVVIHPVTGEINWQPNSDMPSESFHIGIKVSSQTDVRHISLILHAGVKKVLHVGQGQEFVTIKSALKKLQSGETLVVMDGVYEGQDNFIGLSDAGAVQHPASGTEKAFTTVMAKHPSKAVLKNGAYVRLNGKWPVSYVAFKGFFVEDGQMAAVGYGDSKEESDERHHHLKFIRNGVQGDSRSPFNAFRSDDILFENNYAFGGGRYKFASYQAENIVWRRNVARFDRGPVHDEPKGTYSVYSTLDAFLSNNLAIDGNKPDFVVTGELAGEFTTPTTSGATRALFHRNIQLNSAFLFGNMDDQTGDSDVEHRDIISWDVKPDSRYVMSWGSAWFDHMTMGEVQPRNFADQFFNGYHNNSRGVTNSILHNFSNGDMFYSLRKEFDHETVGRQVERFGVDSVNISNFTGELDPHLANENLASDLTNITKLNPIQTNTNPKGGLRYLLRVEDESNLSGIGLDGEDLGARVMTLLGRSGTFYGDAGFDEETSIPMWPFPMESIIKQKFSEYEYTGPTYSGSQYHRIETGVGTLLGARGFAIEGETLTNYIWGYLGEPVPPFNLSTSHVEDKLILQWDDAVMLDQAHSYRIYSLSSESSKLIDEVHSLNRTRGYIGLEVGQSCFAVTKVKDGKESAYSYVQCIERES